MRGSYWWVDSDEILQLIQWMRRHNATAAANRQVDFFGFDVQKAENSARELGSFLSAVDPECATANATVLSLFTSNPLASDHLIAATDALERLRVYLEARSKEHSERAGLEAQQRARLHLRVLIQNKDLARVCGQRKGCQAMGRDQFMADNALDHLASRGGKMLVWAHNGHVAHAIHDDGWKPMGHHLKARLGDGMVAIALEFGQGGFVAPGGGIGQTDRTRSLVHLNHRMVAEYILGSPPPETMASTLMQVPLPLFFLPLGSVGEDGPAMSFFMHGPRLHEYGTFPPREPRHHASMPPIHTAYDALIFVRETHGYTFGPG